jgi:hypothetical protein
MSVRSVVFSAVLLAASGVAVAQAQVGRYELLYQGEEVLDKESNLIWQRCTNGMQLAQHRCVGEPDRSNASTNVPTTVRETPWRLPTQAELLSLVLQQNPVGDRSKTVVDEAAFPDTPGDRFQAMYEWGDVMSYVDFSTGRPGSSRPLFHYPVRFVRDGPGNR